MKILKESKRLNENWSKSMPKWLRNALYSEIVDTPAYMLNSKSRDFYNTDSNTDNYSNDKLIKSKDPAVFASNGNTDDRSTSVNSRATRFKNSDDYKPTIARLSNVRQARGSSPSYRDTLYQGFIRQGINLAEAEFISGDAPVKNTDPRIKEPNIPIYHLILPDNKDTVYAVGINDNQYVPFNDPEEGWIDKKFGYLPFKIIKKYAVDFCYLDSSNSKNYIDTGMLDQRRENAKLANSETGYYRKNQVVPHDWWDNSDNEGKYIDKSGYLVDPRKYIKKYESNHMVDVILNNLDACRDAFNSCKNAWASAISDMSIDSTRPVNSWSTVLDVKALRYFPTIEKCLSQAIRAYDKALDYAKEISNYLALNDENSAKSYYNSAKKYVSDVEKYINEAIRAGELDSYITSLADWDDDFEDME